MTQSLHESFQKLHLQNVILHNRIFYVEDKSLEEFLSTYKIFYYGGIGHNINSCMRPLSDLDPTIDTQKIDTLDTPVIATELVKSTFHYLWDCLYPSWFMLRYFLKEKSHDNYLTIYGQDGYPLQGKNEFLQEKFTGFKTFSKNTFFGNFPKTLKISHLLPHLHGLSQHSLNFKRSLLAPCCTNFDQSVSRTMGRFITNEDTVSLFLDRLFERLNIVRPSIFDCNKIAFVKTDRSYTNYVDVQNFIKSKYSDRFSFADFYYKDYLLPNGSDDIEKQIKFFSDCKLVICPQDTSFMRGFFAPIGAKLITFPFHPNDPKSRLRVVQHGGFSLSWNHQILCPDGYSKEENIKKTVPANLITTIEHAICTPFSDSTVNPLDNYPPSLLQFIQECFSRLANTECSNNSWHDFTIFDLK